MKSEPFFSIKTPLKIDVRTTADYWNYLVTFKHPTMRGKEDIVKAVLKSPKEIRQSKIDKDIYLYYRHFDRLYCVVARHSGLRGFIVTAYPTDKIKEGDIIWVK